MNPFNTVWSKVFSAVGILAIPAFFIASIFGSFFVALAGAGGVGDPHMLRILGRTFGTCFLVLVGLGTVFVPLEILNIGRFYDRQAPDVAEKRLQTRTLLLIAVSLFATGSAVSLFLIIARFAR